MSAFTKTIHVYGGYDKRNPDPTKSYGIGAVKLVFCLRGPKGAMTFVVSTGMYPSHVTKEMWNGRLTKTYNPFEPMGFGFDYHVSAPCREYHEADKPSNASCEHIGGVPCWSDGSGLMASEFMPTFLEQGEEAVWLKLEELYHEWIERSEE